MIIQLAVLVPLALGATTPTTTTTERGAAIQVQDEGGGAAEAPEEPGFIEKYYPFSFAEGLEPEVEENFVLLYIAGVLTAFWAPIWLPLVVIGNPADFFIDILISDILHFVPWFFVVVPFIGWIVANLYGLACAFYLMPVATVNIMDRNLKKAKAAGTWTKSSAVRPPDEKHLRTAAMAY